MKKVCSIIGILAVMILCISCSTVNAGQLPLSWVPPSTYEDGTALSTDEQFTYKLYCGLNSGKYSIITAAGIVNNYSIPLLPDGTYFCVATAISKNGMESAYSNEVSKKVLNLPGKIKLQ
jgi:hypothetical protein